MSDLLELVQWRQVPDRLLELYRHHESELQEAWTKSGYSKPISRVAQALNILPGTYPGGIPNHASPLTGMLFGGMAGSGLGYGLGAIAESVLPEKWKKQKLRRTMAILGGGLGAMPGAGMGVMNSLSGKPFNSMSMWHSDINGNPRTFEVTPDKLDMASKSAETSAGMFNSEPIDVNEFNQIVWKDPRVSRSLSPQMQAAATGLVTGAANLPGKVNSRWVTPMDIGRMAAGMGVGYLSGSLVGAGLGALMGMPEETQDRLKSTGMWAGLLTELVPKAFGG